MIERMANKRPVQVVVTGPTGTVGYALLFRLASGQVFGADQPLVLRLWEIEEAMKTLEGLVMELDDCAFPQVADIVATADLSTAFDGTNWAILIGSLPRRAGMERKDLLTANGGIFKPQGEAIAAHAADDVRVLVVGNPCNTNCLIAAANAPGVPPERFFAMTRLDQNRAAAQLARKANAHAADVTNMAIWGNHSATQFPDFTHARVAGRPATEVIERRWLEDDFLAIVQQRGAAVIDARGASSAGSAASAVVDSIASIRAETRSEDWFSAAIVSRGEYGIPEGLVFSYPLSSDGNGSWLVVEGLDLDGFARSKLDATTAELEEERNAVRDLLGR